MSCGDIAGGMHWVAHAPARILIFLVEAYRTWVSPIRSPACRFTPTCSEYAITALRSHGLVCGLGLALVRVLKCAPWHPGGFDPVPERQGSSAQVIGETNDRST